MEIWKFEIRPTRQVEMPRGARILSVGAQGGRIMLWAMVDRRAQTEARRFPVYGTGHLIADDDKKLPFIGTVFLGSLVFHVFDAGVESI